MDSDGRKPDSQVGDGGRHLGRVLQARDQPQPAHASRVPERGGNQGH
jgi:hypothetical protein